MHLGAPQSLEIRLIGEPEVVVGGRARALPASKKTRALLGYLVRTGRPQRRERLCELLWDGPDDPRAGLRWSLAKLRPLTDADGAVRLVADRERVGFEAHGADVDVLAVGQLHAAGVQAASDEVLLQALARFRGPFLEGLELSSCPAFHAWCVAEREALRAAHVGLLTALIARQREEPVRAIAHARALIALDPLAESARLVLLDLLSALGDTRRALDEYDDYARTLRRELGAAPSFELERRRMALTRSPVGGALAPPEPAPSAPEPQPSARAPGGLAPDPLPRSVAPFVGRAREREALVRVLDGAAGQPPVLLVLGEPGIGKTRLLEELAHLTRERGGLAFSGRAFEAELVRPYGAFVDALRSGLGDRIGRDQSPFTASAADRTQLYDAVLGVLTGAAEERPPLVLVLDDLHWFDEASAELFHYLARARGSSPLLLATSARKGELADNPAAQRLIRALGREGLVTSIELGPLGDQDLGALLGPRRDTESLRALITEAAGNPLFALEAARSLEAGGQDRAGSLARLMAERLGRLQDADRALLSWAGALGRSFDVDVLSSVTGLPLPELLASLERLERHAILRSRDTGYDFAHDLFRQAAYRQMSGPRQRLVHAQIARALAAAPDPDGALAGDVAHHAALAGDSALAARACSSAGRRCLRLFASREARDLAIRGLRLAESLQETERLPLVAELLAIQVWAEPRPALSAKLTELTERARELGLAAVEAKAYFLRSILQFRADDSTAALESSLSRIEAARQASAPELGAELAGAARCCLMIEKNVGEAEQFVEQAQFILGDESEHLDLIWSQGLLAHRRGDLAQATERIGRALALARRQQGYWEECQCLLELAWIELDRGDHQRAMAPALALARVAHKVGEGAFVPAAESVQALAGMMAARTATSAAFEHGLAAVREAGGNRVLAMLLTRAAEWAFGLGADEVAGPYAAEALAAAQRVECASEIVAASVTLAEIALRAGQLERARVHFEALSGQLAVAHLPARNANALARLPESLRAEAP